MNRGSLSDREFYQRVDILAREYVRMQTDDPRWPKIRDELAELSVVLKKNAGVATVKTRYCYRIPREKWSRFLHKLTKQRTKAEAATRGRDQ